MIDLGTVRPGSTIRIPFSSFDKDDGSAITMTNYAAADILVYKDGSTTERASTSGYTATTDFDSKTGKHLAVIDLSDNTTSGFWNAGSEYIVAIDSVTIDTVTTGGWIARFRIGYPSALIDTTIATLSSQTSFTLTTGPAEDDALNNHYAIIHDIASAVQLSRVLISDYTGSTKTVTLASGATFTAAAGDNISILYEVEAVRPTVAGRTLDVSSGGEAGVDWANVGTPGSTVNLSATTVKTATDVETDTADIQSRLPAALGANGNIKVDVRDINGTTIAGTGTRVADGFVAMFNVASPVFTLASVNQTGDSYAIVNHGTNGNAAIKTQVAAIETDTQDIQARIPAALTADGNIKADTLRIGGTLQTARDIGASVLLSSGTGTGQLDFTSGIVKSDMRKTGGQLVDTVSPVDGNGYPYVNTIAFGSTASTIVDDIRAFQYIVVGNTASATSSTVVGPNDFSTINDFYKNCLIYIGSGTGIGQIRLCTGYTGSSRTFAISPNWDTTPAAADKIYVIGAGLSGGIYGNTVQTGDAYAVVSNGTYGNSALNTDIDSIITLLSSTGIALTAAERNAVADALLGRNVAGGSSTGRTVSQALFRLRNRCAIAAGTFTVYSTDDTTSSWTAALTTDDTLDPVSDVNPA